MIHWDYFYLLDVRRDVLFCDWLRRDGAPPLDGLRHLGGHRRLRLLSVVGRHGRGLGFAGLLLEHTEKRKERYSCSFF